MEDLSGVWDFTFFWDVFGYLLNSASPFVMITVAILAVGLLIWAIITAVKAAKG